MATREAAREAITREAAREAIKQLHDDGQLAEGDRITFTSRDRMEYLSGIKTLR